MAGLSLCREHGCGLLAALYNKFVAEIAIELFPGQKGDDLHAHPAFYFVDDAGGVFFAQRTSPSKAIKPSGWLISTTILDPGLTTTAERIKSPSWLMSFVKPTFSALSKPNFSEKRLGWRLLRRFLPEFTVSAYLNQRHIQRAAFAEFWHAWLLHRPTRRRLPYRHPIGHGCWLWQNIRQT